MPLDPAMCMEQFADTIRLVELAQSSPYVEEACSEAERRCAELFDEFYAAGDRTMFIVMLGYLAMDLAANVSYTLGRAAIRDAAR